MSADSATIVSHKHHFSFNPIKLARKIAHFVTSFVPHSTKQKHAVQSNAIIPQSQPQGSHITKTSPIAETSLTRDVLTAATREAWTDKDPGPRPDAYNHELGTGAILSRARSKDSLIEAYQTPCDNSTTTGPNSSRSSYDALPGSVAEYIAPSTSTQTRATATRAYSSTSQDQSKPSPQLYLDWAKQYWNMSKDITLEDLTRIGAYTKAKDAAEYAAVLGVTEGVNLALEIYRSGLQSLQNPSLNIDVNADKTRFWHNVVTALETINRNPDLHCDSEQNIPSLFSINKYDPNMTPAMVGARFIRISNTTYNPEESMFRSSAQTWMHHFNTAVSTKEIPYEVQREYHSAQTQLRYRQGIIKKL